MLPIAEAWAYYPELRRFVEREERGRPHLAVEIERFAWLAFDRAVLAYDPARGVAFLTFLRFALDRGRPAGRRAMAHLPLLEALAPAPADRASGADLIDLAAALGRLTDRERELIDLRYREGLTVRAIGARWGRCYSGVCKAEARALARLRTLLDGPPP